MEIGNILKELRLNKGKSQQEVADKTGISRSVLSQYEHNTVEPTANVVSKFAVYFDVSTDYLLGLEDDFGTPTVAPMGDTGLSSEEHKLLDVYRSLSPEMQETLWSLLATWEPVKSLKPLKK